MPAGTPQPVVSKLFDVTQKTMKDATVNKRLNDGGVPAIVSKSPEEFAKFVKEETERFGKVIRTPRSRRNDGSHDGNRLEDRKGAC